MIDWDRLNELEKNLIVAKWIGYRTFECLHYEVNTNCSLVSSHSYDPRLVRCFNIHAKESCEHYAPRVNNYLNYFGFGRIYDKLSIIKKDGKLGWVSLNKHEDGSYEVETEWGVSATGGTPWDAAAKCLIKGEENG